MGNTIATTYFYNGHAVTIYPAGEPQGPTCLCSKCGNPINKPIHSPVRVTDVLGEVEMRFHAQCYQDFESITSPSDGAQTTIK